MGGGTTAAVIAAIAAGGTLLLRLTEPIATARREVAQHNLAALFAHEDIGSWVDDENQAFARRLEEIDRRLAARGMLQSGERGHQEQEARRDQTQRWRDRERAYRRTVDRLKAEEGFSHRFWRYNVLPKRLRLPDWPANEREEEIVRVARGWTPRLP